MRARSRAWAARVHFGQSTVEVVGNRTFACPEVEAAASGLAASSPSRKWLAAIQHAPTAKAGLARRPAVKRLILQAAVPMGRLAKALWPLPALLCFLSRPFCGVAQPGSPRIMSPAASLQAGNLGCAGPPHHQGIPSLGQAQAHKAA